MMGEYLCLLAYGWKTWRTSENPIESPDSRKAKQENKKEPNRLLFAVPAIFDVLGSTCNFFGLSRVAASVYQMMRAFMIVVTTVLSVLFLGRKYHIHQMIGVALVIGGVIVVGTVSIHNTSGGAAADALGIVFLLTAQCFSGIMMVTEEKLIKGSGHVTPLLAIGLEGLSGCTLLILVLPFLNLIPCTPSYDSGPEHRDLSCPFGYFEDSPSAIAQIFGEYQLTLLVFGSMVSIALFNFFGISITQILSSSSRAVIDPTRTLFIWVMSIALGWERFRPLQLVGFLISTTGMLIFNEYLALPFLGIDYNWRAKLEARDKKRKELIDSGLLKAIDQK